MKSLDRSLGEMRRRIAQFDTVAIGFTGGIASTIVLKIAHSLLGSRCLAVTVNSPFLSTHLLEESRRIAEAIGVSHSIITQESAVFRLLAHNSPFRYYHYMRGIFGSIQKEIGPRGIGSLMVGHMYAGHAHCRGFRKAASEFGVISPLEESGITEQDISFLTRLIGLEIASTPSTAFLASKIPYGMAITPELLLSLDKAEQIFHRQGIHHSRFHLNEDNFLVLIADHRDIAHIAGCGDQLTMRISKHFAGLEIRLQETE